jgi:hypothetical protein
VCAAVTYQHPFHLTFNLIVKCSIAHNKKFVKLFYKDFDRPFLKGRRFLGQHPKSTSAEGETSLTSKKVPLFGNSFGVPWRIHRRWILERGVDIV